MGSPWYESVNEPRHSTPIRALKHYTRSQKDSIAHAARIDGYSRCYAVTIRNEIPGPEPHLETSERNVVHSQRTIAVNLALGKVQESRCQKPHKDCDENATTQSYSDITPTGSACASFLTAWFRLLQSVLQAFVGQHLGPHIPSIAASRGALPRVASAEREYFPGNRQSWLYEKLTDSEVRGR
jgi:hypothetical protein